jgi:hypothetical protein
VAPETSLRMMQWWLLRRQMEPLNNGLHLTARGTSLRSGPRPAGEAGPVGPMVTDERWRDAKVGP